MAIKFNATYSKKLGLPGLSSHQFSVSVETELVTTDDIPAESQRLCNVSGVPSTIRIALHWPLHSSHSSAIYDCYVLTRSCGFLGSEARPR